MTLNQKISLLAAAIVCLAPHASAHIRLKNPVPFGDLNNDQPSLSPLTTDGSNFPCQNVPYTINQMNDWPVGSQQTLEFDGTAVHNGGSCQVVVTTDKEPTKDSNWKVIYSIEGGCPGVGGAASTFPFSVPKELPNGELAGAWTWANKIGNREFYMNCFPIKVSGGNDDTTAFEKLPDIAIANIPIGDGANCKTPESSDYVYENPGEYKTRIGSGPFVPLCGGAAVNEPGAPGATPAPGAPVAPSAPNNGLYTPPASQASASQGPIPSSPASQAPGSSQGGEDQTVAGPSASGTPKVTSTFVELVTVTASGPNAPLTPTTQSSQPAFSFSPAEPAQPTQAPSNSEGGGSTCTTDGAIVCNGDSQFGLCNQGSVIWQSVAAGTKCQGGQIVKRDYTHRIQRSAY